MPFYDVLMEQGWKQAAGIGLLFLFLVTYRQLYHSFNNQVLYGLAIDSNRYYSLF